MPFTLKQLKNLKSSNTPRNSRNSFQHNLTYNQNIISVSPVMEQEVVNVINKLKGSQSVGFDEILELVLKSSVLNIKTPLTHIFNLSF
jgi:hypothetical protein